MNVLKKAASILILLAVALAQAGPAFAAPAVAATSVGRVAATAVVEDKTVTLAGSGLLVNTRYNVFLAKYGKYPSGAVQVGFAVTDAKGAFSKTYRIPGKLVDIPKISIHLVSSRGDTATNWFINASANGNTGGSGSPEFSFTVTQVRTNTWVKIKTTNLPANVPFEVRIGKAGTKGVNGVKVGELRSDKGGSVRATFDIPASLESKKELDIRIESKALGVAYFVTFTNK
jgi:hypothetical protein